MTLEKIKSGIYQWGFYPALYLLREEQEKENYENCKVIKQALDEVGKGREWYLSSQVDDNSMDEIYDKIMEGLKNPSNVDANMPYYIEEFKKYVAQ